MTRSVRRATLGCEHIKMDRRKPGIKVGVDSTGSGQGPVARSTKHCNEVSGSMKSEQLFGHFVTSRF